MMPSRRALAVAIAILSSGTGAANCGDSDATSSGAGAGTTGGTGSAGAEDGNDNLLPVAVIRATPPSGVAPLTVQLSGSESTDADGQIVSYAWSIDHELDVGLEVTHVFEAGCHPIQLSVTDDDGGIATAATAVAVAATSSDPPPTCE